MSGEGVLLAPAGAVPPGELVSRSVVAELLVARAATIEARRSPERVQTHSRLLPNETELAEARYAARQLRALADDIRGGLDDFGKVEGAPV